MDFYFMKMAELVASRSSGDMPSEGVVLATYDSLTPVLCVASGYKQLGHERAIDELGFMPEQQNLNMYIAKLDEHGQPLPIRLSLGIRHMAKRLGVTNIFVYSKGDIIQLTMP